MAANPPGVVRFSRPEAETCEYIGADGVYWSSGPQIFCSDTVDGPVRPVARIPRPLHRRILCRNRFGRRALRETFYNLIPLDDGSLFYTYAREAGRISPNGDITPISGRMREHRVLRGGVAVLPDGSVVFGEYFYNTKREAVHIYRIRPGKTVADIVYRFAPEEVRHIHSVRRDPYGGRIIVCTGDIGHECKILSFDSDFGVPEILGCGSEEWRTVGPQFAPDALYFGTDAQFTSNHLIRYDRVTGGCSALAPVNGPVFYSAALTNGWLFATSAELCSSQTSPEAILYFIDAASEKVSMIARFEKDRLSKRYFQLGILNLPLSSVPQTMLPVSGVALKNFDAKFIGVRI